MTFAEYVKQNWLTVNADSNGWYITHDVSWAIRKMAKEGWKVVRTGKVEIMADDSVRTYISVA
jgi:hypothetical protein